MRHIASPRFSRSFIPPGPATHYRLTVPLPLTVAFPSISYVSSFRPCQAGRHEFVAHDATAGAWWPVGPVYLAPEFLERAVFEIGVPVRPATVGETIMRRRVLDGRAERMPPPDVDLMTMRPERAPHLGARLNAVPERRDEIGRSERGVE